MNRCVNWLERLIDSWDAPENMWVPFNDGDMLDPLNDDDNDYLYDPLSEEL